MSTTRSEQKICIIGGFTEGNHHTTKFVRLLREAGFGITKPGYNYRIARGVARFRFKLLRTHTKQTIVITNRDDLWTKHIPRRALQEEPTYTFIGLAGAHDDLWMNPERYVAIIRASL